MDRQYYRPNRAAAQSYGLALLGGGSIAAGGLGIKGGIAVLAAATDVMPDDTYLTEIELRGRKVTLTGHSAAASRLIGALAAAGGFRNPGFAAPITRIEALHSELFTIVAEAGS